MRRFDLTPFSNGFNDLMNDTIKPAFDKLPFGGFNMDMKETDKEYVVKADIPGYDKDDINISISDGALTIEAAKDEENEVKEGRYIRRERTSGKMVRTIMLDDSMDHEKISAALDNGVLTITIPKVPVPEKEVKKIEID